MIPLFVISIFNKAWDKGFMPFMGILHYLTRCFNWKIHEIVWNQGACNGFRAVLVTGNPLLINRVCEIKNLVAPTQWKFCKKTENPADVLSRGYSESELLNEELSMIKVVSCFVLFKFAD